MKYFSTNHQSLPADFREATIRGLAPDRGLYFPEQIPAADQEMMARLSDFSKEEIAYRVIRPYVGEVISEKDLYRIVSATIDFPIPLVPLNSRISALELFHGPTLAFKDIGARFMSRCLGYFFSQGYTSGHSSAVTVLVATSGDTGGAVAHGFYGVEGVEVVILYPSGMVSPVQEKQLTTLGKNIHALEIQGSFDDCQDLVKQAFADVQLREKCFLTSANSINIARWLPQQFYYFFALMQWKEKDNPPVISVPSGNFGNICAGLLAMQSGLPVRHFIAACNSNDIVSGYLEKGILEPRVAQPTLSNAMDVGNPSNFIRMLEIFGHRFPELKQNLTAYSISDPETEKTIHDIYRETGYTLDPHGAVGYLALSRYLGGHPGSKGFFLETAHPVKFPDAVKKNTGVDPVWPANIEQLMQKEKSSLLMAADYSVLKDYLWNKG